jgi:hypothetical protein
MTKILCRSLIIIAIALPMAFILFVSTITDPFPARIRRRLWNEDKKRYGL